MPPLAGERWYEVPKGERVVVSQWGRSAARVQKVQKVLPACSGRVQRVVVAPYGAMSFIISLRGIKTIQPGCARGKTIQPR